MAEQVPAFRASDGEVFWTSEDADAYEVKLASAAQIERYISDAGHKPRQRTRVKNIITDFLGWVETGKSEMTPEPEA